MGEKTHFFVRRFCNLLKLTLEPNPIISMNASNVHCRPLYITLYGEICEGKLHPPLGTSAFYAVPLKTKAVQRLRAKFFV